MAKVLTALKVAEVREQLSKRGESTEGKKVVLVQRLSDWLEDNGFDPDSYDFNAVEKAADEKTDPIPPLEEVKSVEPETVEKTAEVFELDSDIRTTDDEEKNVPPKNLVAQESKSEVEEKDVLDELDYHESETEAVTEAITVNPDEKSVWISGLKETVSATHIKNAFTSIAKVLHGKVVQKMAAGQRETFGFVSFQSAHDAMKIKERFDGKALCGSEVCVVVVQDDPSDRKRKTANESATMPKRPKANQKPAALVDLTEGDDECELEIEANRLDREIQKAKSTLDQTQRQVKTSEREHSRNMSELSRLRNTADGIKREIGRLRTERVEAQNKQTKLKSDLEKEHGVFKKLEADLANLKRERAEIAKTKGNVLQEKKRLKGKIDGAPQTKHSAEAWPQRNDQTVVRPFQSGQQHGQRHFPEPTGRAFDTNTVTVTYGSGSNQSARSQAGLVPSRGVPKSAMPSRSTMPSRTRNPY